MGTNDKILVIDDEEAVRTSFQMYLEDSGYRVILAENGRQGTELFDSESPQCVLVDLRMPEMGGHEVIEYISRADENVPIIVVSGTDVLEDAIKALRKGAWDYLTKPVLDMAGLLHRVEETLERSRLIRQNQMYREHLESLVKSRTEELENTNRALSRAVYNTVVILTQTIEAKDPYTRGHSLRVSEYSVAIGKRMGLDRKSIQILRLGSLLHDIGKIGISSSVLNKPGRLTSKEYDLIKEHTIIGERILQNVDFFKPILPLVKSHHRWHDGNGYPELERGNDVPLESEILSVADVYDALTSDRPYRGAMSRDTALSVLKEVSGTQLSPDIVKLFIDQRIYDIEHSKNIMADIEILPDRV
ncbi:MAG: response regulator [Candidatus Fermentibacteraceae bacterium]|nr:response regulator [Candidatus Fermentibacteraceae bacterium]MBN2608114.1 response regulator [Candidatus Fermentibacteraceae bacterium]